MIYKGIVANNWYFSTTKFDSTQFSVVVYDLCGLTKPYKADIEFDKLCILYNFRSILTSFRYSIYFLAIKICFQEFTLILNLIVMYIIICWFIPKMYSSLSIGEAYECYFGG